MLTVEEIILMKLTNDRAEFITPQVAHIAFTEFKKFIFLNKYFLEQERKRDAAASEKEKEAKAAQSRAKNVGLFAPPLIDSIWAILISLDIQDGKSSSQIFKETNLTSTIGKGQGTRIYETFSRDIFGFVLDRPILKELDKEEKIRPNHKYEQTITYLKNFANVIKPIYNFWPMYSHEDYTNEICATVWATPKQISSFITSSGAE